MLKLLLLCVAVSLVLAVRPIKYHKTTMVHNKELSPEPIDMDYGVPEPKPLIDIFPPDNFPGEILKSIEFSKIDRALDEVMKSGDMFHDRRCAVGIANEGEAGLSNPKWEMRSGGTHSMVTPIVLTGETSLNLFLKTKGAARGTVGVVSYDIAGTNHKVVIMWNVPFDRNLYNINFNMKVYERHINTNKDLCKHMFDDAGPLKPNQWHERTEFGVKMWGTITDNTHSKLIVWVNADGFDPNGGYDLYTECSYHPWWIGDYCNQECYGGGWCWVDKKCDDDSNCIGRHSCYSGC